MCYPDALATQKGDFWLDGREAQLPFYFAPGATTIEKTS
jgi:hypothetical protein